MLRVKALLLLAVTTVVFAGCGGVGEAETTNGAGTTPPTDTTPPSPPTVLTAAVAGSTGANLSWSASTDNVGVTAYILLRNGVQVATPATTSYADTGLSPATTYSYTVAARDAAGNISPSSASVSITIADTTPPTTPTGLTAAAAGSTGASLSWNVSTDNVGVTGYIVRRNGVQIATPVTTGYADTGLSAATTYSYTVAARDAAGNISPDSTSVSVTTTIAADTTPPTTPTGLTAAVAGSTGANLSWSASTDNVGVTGYIVRRNGVQIATPAATSYADTGLSAATTYSYTVAARDAAGNISPNSTSVSVTTAPSNSATLTWDAVTVPTLSGYRFYFGTAPGMYLQSLGQGIGVGNVMTYTITGLANRGRYFFAVTAFDTSGNESPYSNEVFKDIP